MACYAHAVSGTCQQGATVARTLGSASTSGAHQEQARAQCGSAVCYTSRSAVSDAHRESTVTAVK
jgi:hypothetical protein